MRDLIAELIKRFGLWIILALIAWGALVWVIAHSQAKPGEKVSILWGMVEYTKGKLQPEPESTIKKKHKPFSTTRPPRTITEPTSTSIVEKNDITFELQECKITGNNITCNLIIISKMDVAPEGFIMHIKGNFASKIVDYGGNEYFASIVKLGEKSHNRSVEDGLYANIPKMASLYFENIPMQEEKIAVLELECFLLPGERITVPFHNIPLSREGIEHTYD